MSEPIEFKDFGKTPRFRTIQAIVTEKIDGTNAQIYVPANPEEPILAGSRNRWITPGKTTDNFGFAAWVEEHAAAFRRLGPGRHFGEWYGAGVGRRYGLDHKRFALFDVHRFAEGLPEGLPGNVELVPVLYRGPVDIRAIEQATANLYATGSVAVPGWMKPEGVVINVAGMRWKITDNGDAHKGAAAGGGEEVHDAGLV
jgi:hypothetical protein